jgi:hypothetical protein
MMKKAAVLTLAGLTLAATTVFAAVIFDSDTGSGFVGKGDVQLAYGWNNAQLQSKADGLSFAYEAVDVYSAVCSWKTGEGTPGENEHNVSHRQRTGVMGAIDYDARKRNQINGFTLNGWDGSPVTVGGSVPEVGGACHGNAGHGGEWSSVTLLSSSGGLVVSHAEGTHNLQ